MSPKIRTALSWVLKVLLAILFTLAALPKLTGAEGWVMRFDAWGYPLWFMYVTGVLEIIGAIGLLIPRFAPRAALGLVVVMIGAAATHAMAGEWPRVPINLGYLAALLIARGLQGPIEVSEATASGAQPDS